MDKTLAIVLGGVTVAGIGLFAYLKLRKSPLDLDSKSTTVANLSNGASTSDTEKQELDKKEKEIKQQLLSRPESLSDVQAVAYAIDKPESLNSLKVDALLKQGSMGSLILRKIYEQDKPILASKAYWKSTGRPKGHTVKVLSNDDQTPATLNDDQAIIYLGTYPQVRKAVGFNLTKAKENWLKEGRSAGRKIDLY